ncbi:DUF885 domain-containing protein [Kitasatospora sp. KL5]|uniref:DUF885 domain-containing protein n=1 Tax=Kitasatospora sp. KL5 TaxID=3425125 RepID=UPI003D6E7CC6
MTTVAELADRTLDLIAEEDPLNDALEGHPGFEHRLRNLAEEADEDLADRARRIAGTARTLECSGQDGITRAVVVQQAEALADRVGARLVEHTVADYDTSPLGRLLVALPALRPSGEAGEEGYLARLASVPAYLAEAAGRLRGGLAAGRVPVAERAHRAVARLGAYLDDPAGDPLAAVPVAARRAAERDRLLAEAVRPAFARYREVLAGIAPHGRPQERPGLCWLPDGAAVYARLARIHTTTDRTAEELHRTGLELLAALDEEYPAVGGRLFGVRTAAEVRQRMRSDPSLRWSGPEELLADARAAVERAEKAAPAWFGRLPSHACVLAAVPEADAPHSPAAYYLPPALNGSRPGTYFANTHLAHERFRFTSEALAFHEAVPGHHVQLALAQELEGLPALRRLAWINSYIEGWGLYTERLAQEMGLYSGDVPLLGVLAMDSLRAARLVVDTGLHALGWSREEAVAFLRTNTVMAEVDIQSETDRYIEMPGQALSYMVGRLELQRLRARAAAEAGPAFDVRAFHDLVLGNGPLPLSVLDEVLADRRPLASGPVLSPARLRAL